MYCTVPHLMSQHWSLRFFSKIHQKVGINFHATIHGINVQLNDPRAVPGNKKKMRNMLFKGEILRLFTRK